MIAQQVDPHTAPVLRRVVRQHKVRQVAFWNRTTGRLVSDLGAGLTIQPDAPLSLVLDLIRHTAAPFRVRSLFVIGGDDVSTTPRRSWWAEPVAAGWRYDGYELAAHAASGGADAHENAGQYRSGDGPDACQVDVRMSALWFPGVSDPQTCRDAWRTLRKDLSRAFDEHATLLATPALTGLDLLHRSLPRDVAYPLAPEPLRELLHSISGQGRFEFCPDPIFAGQEIPGLYILDARWMYAACVRNLPVGAPTHTSYPHGADADEAYAPYRPGWYRVSVRVPRDWTHLGLIATRAEGDSEWRWPATPGEWIRDVWTTGSELALALTRGWSCLIHERWVYEHALPGRNAGDPTRTWATQLRTLRELRQDNQPVAAAIRHLLIDTVGMWHRQAGEKLRITPLSDFPGAAAGARMHHIDRKAGLAYWYESKPLGRDMLAWQRPEWSSTTWGRAKTRENTAGLLIPRTQLVSYRADALITCVEPPAAIWPDDGQPGTFRRKPGVPGPLTMPATKEELLQLRRDARETREDGE